MEPTPHLALSKVPPNPQISRAQGDPPKIASSSNSPTFKQPKTVRVLPLLPYAGFTVLFVKIKTVKVVYGRRGETFTVVLRLSVVPWTLKWVKPFGPQF